MSYRVHRHTHTHTQTERHRHADRQTDRHTDTQTDMSTLLLRLINRNYNNVHVVHVLTRSMFKKYKTPVAVSMQFLQDKCVLVSPCVCTKRPPAPADFPCQMAIAAGLEQLHEDKTKGVQISKKNQLKEKEKQSKGEDIELRPLITPRKYQVKWQSYGSTLNFVCHRQYGDIKINNPWEASYFVTAITALILVKAYALSEYVMCGIYLDNNRR